MQNFGFKMFAQHGIDMLLALNPAQAGKNIADDYGLKMPTVADYG